jgi:hypothetical protein
MSYTQTDHVFGGLGETGVATFFKALFDARPRYLNYATPGLAPADSVNVTQIPAGPFGLQYSIAFSLPGIDIFPPDTGDPVPPATDQITISTQAKISIGSGSSAVSAVLDIYVVCSPYLLATTSASRTIGLRVVSVTVLNVQPSALAAVLGALLQAFVEQALANTAIPLGALMFPPITLVLKDGPTAEADRLDVRGDLQ